mgnify:CR=1 FL=1
MPRLRRVDCAGPGLTRRRRGKGFEYLDEQGNRVDDVATLQRIKDLGIPPAWTDVWICPNPRGHLQATGRDARGRKQYRYHPKWREVRDETKFGRMIAFGEALPKIRERIDRDMSLRGLSREKVLATVVQLLEATLIRVGNKEYPGFPASGAETATTISQKSRTASTSFHQWYSRSAISAAATWSSRPSIPPRRQPSPAGWRECGR